ncbi:MAG: ABC transporter permease [Thermoplasmatota archaeon]
MKIGKLMLMELRNSWKGYLIFLIIILLTIGGFTQAYPSVSEAFDPNLEGAENIDIQFTEGTESASVNLSWVEVKGAKNYTIVVGYSPTMIVPITRIEGIETNEYEFTLPLEEDMPELYFAVLAVKEEIIEEEYGTEFIGMETNIERESPFEELWGIDYSDIRGFLSVLWSMWWIPLIGLYIGYISVNSVVKDYEEDRIDILLSKPISRKQYLLEKFSVISIYTLFLLAISGGILVASVHSVGELGTVSASEIMISTILSWPIFLVIISVSVLGSVVLENSKKAVGLSFIFILIQFGIHLVGDMAETLEYMKSYTIITYWDYESLIYGETINIGEVGLIIALAAILVIITLWIFERKDIPV